MSLLYFYKYTTIEAFLIILGVLVLIDLPIALTLRRLRKWKWIFLTHVFIAISVYTIVAWAFFIHHWERNPETFSVFFFLTNHLTILYLSKIAFLFLAWIFLVVNRKFVIISASVLFIVFSLLLWGLYLGRFNYVIKENVIFSKKNFQQPLKIACITDLHLGQYYGHEDKFGRLVRIINEQNPDLILLGGDIICCFAEEMKPFVSYLRQLKAKYGIYAVHGNHDYGDYFWWRSQQEKLWNHQLLEYYYQQANIKLLNNEHVKLAEHNIVLVGLENCGHPPYGCYADWKRALSNIPAHAYTILLVHDPWNWGKVVAEYPQVKLTLSGHTHAYQFGIDNGRTRWSPFHPKNPWCGLYARKDQYLYISHGVGSAMFSARLGMWPEITIITLR